jgi:hypothetical protein
MNSDAAYSAPALDAQKNLTLEFSRRARLCAPWPGTDEAWFGGTLWPGWPALWIGVSSWRTTARMRTRS